MIFMITPKTVIEFVLEYIHANNKINNSKKKLEFFSKQ